MEPLCRRGLFALINYSKFRLASTSAASSVSKPSTVEKWDIIGAVCLQRRPVIAPPLTEMETKFSNLLKQIELERSLKCDHEFRHESDILRLERMKSGESDESDLDQAALQTAQDFEDACQEELNSFLKMSAEKTSPKADDDKKSLERVLDRHLHFVVQQPLGSKAHWVLPHAVWNNGETLRQTAERVLGGYAEKSQFVVMGNAPCGFYKFKYPKAVQKENGVVGGKVFFFKAFLKPGATVKSASSKETNHVWLTQKELPEYLSGEYHHSVSQFLIDED